ncbi:hypothetical protein GCM10007938_03640 [Vibrio zhanjiangensis]|uniref:Solute-binding protein family 3/N-terminal domain-containing protein n=1 Tax=Vibrio zhanjiangensis TaxID=1046128 RepID=A0ABQ6ETW3_9VIBR|nr:transporter substrate-binding domain-containing protein [Vibrio zhanjiangensis]GLT16588.1 hypothetical protein GCM10007938_03640 [Vibrio zhanjiangensis]
MCSVLSAQEQDVVKVAIGEGFRGKDKKTRYGMTAEEVLNAIYAGAGIKVELTYMPDERAIQSVLTGEYDALDLRINKFESDHSERLVRVNVPLADFDTYLFSIENKRYSSLAELQNKNVVSMHGTRYVNELSHYQRLKLVYREEQAALMLVAGRADVWLAPMQAYMEVKEKFPTIKLVSPPMTKDHLYHYLHISKSYLREPLEVSAKRLMESFTKKPDN